MRMLPHVIGMFVLGAAALISVGLLYRARTTEPIPLSPALRAESAVGTSGSTASAGGAASAAADRALDGVRSDLGRFAAAVGRGDRAEAAAALDGAYHLADVLKAAAGQRDLFERVDRIRHALQNGDVPGAASGALQASAMAFAPATVRAPADPAQYAGATALSPTGDVAGTLRLVSGRTVTIEQGGVRDLLGFVDITPGTTRSVPIDDVLFGAPRRLGMRMVIDTSIRR